MTNYDRKKIIGATLGSRTGRFADALATCPLDWSLVPLRRYGKMQIIV